MLSQFENKGLTLVIVGSFAPAMFHPLWFKSNELLGEQEARAAAEKDSVLVSDDLTVFTVAGMDVRVRQDRFQVGTTQENMFGPVRDMVVGTMQLLDSTAVRAVGINWTAHFRLESRDKWHEAGHKMIPHAFWSRVWNKHVGMKSVTVNLERNDERAGYVQVTVQPSTVVETGVYVSLNDHYLVVKDNGEPNTGAQAAAVVQEQLDASEKVALQLFEQVERECRSV